MAQAGEVLRALPYPVLEDGNLSYPDGGYTAEVIRQDDTGVTICHKISQVPFLDRVIRQGQAKYGCLVAVPLTGYRELHLSADALQHIKWDMAVVGEPPMLRPLIVSVAEISCALGSDDGVAEAWQGPEITFPKGARLALRSYLRTSSSAYDMLEIDPNQEMPAGSFEVSPCTEEGFYFRVSVASDLYSFFQNAGGHENHCESILTHILSRCFEIVEQKYSDPSEEDEKRAEWEQFSNLKALADELRLHNLPVWGDDDFSADKVATQFRPHKPSVELEE